MLRGSDCFKKKLKDEKEYMKYNENASRIYALSSCDSYDYYHDVASELLLKNMSPNEL
ncbi:MAG: hypothetical protein NT126_02245 [Bacteroidetes bacterium]|nr:hypothetical protein [Bacteroidota bacterium]